MDPSQLHDTVQNDSIGPMNVSVVMVRITSVKIVRTNTTQLLTITIIVEILIIMAKEYTNVPMGFLRNSRSKDERRL